jgi:protein-disulfide isomerase
MWNRHCGVQFLPARRAIVAVGLLSGASWCAAATPATNTPPAAATTSDTSPRMVLATIGGERLTVADVIAQDQADFDRLQQENDLRLHQLQQRQAETRYKLLQQQTDKVLDRKALDMEAKLRGSTAEAVLAEVNVAAVTEDEARAFFEANKSRANGRTFEQLQVEITQHLAAQHNNDAMRSFLDRLRAKHGIASLLPPYRVAVEATGPAKGRERAPVTIVEFGDFECPYCRQEETAIGTVLQRHPEDVRLVFRELPLTAVHPNALAAAHAAVCADRQGKFWSMHDAMYQDQTALGGSALVETARRIGLDVEHFSACLSAEDTLNAVEQDSKAADELNINETPYFLINGRPLHGAVPLEQLEAVINDELQRATAKHG